MNKNYITLEEHNQLVRKKINFPPDTRMIVEGAGGRLYLSDATTLVLTRLDKSRSKRLEYLVGRESKFLKEMCSAYDNVRVALSSTIQDKGLRQRLGIDAEEHNVEEGNQSETQSSSESLKGEENA